MPNTVDARLLLGWMGKVEALRLLREEAALNIPLTENAAIDLWESYKAKVAALGNRQIPAPAFAPLSFREKQPGDRYIKRLRKQGATNIRLAKVDPMGLLVHQLQIVTGGAATYTTAMQSPVERIRTCLGTNALPPIIKSRREADRTVIELPHFEFQFKLENGQVKIEQLARHVALSTYKDRLLLWGGYHRTYALMSQEYPEEMDRLLLAILTTDAEAFLDADADKRALVCGPCPALFRDFFNDDLCMSIKLRKRRRELHVLTTVARVETVYVDDDT